MATARQRKTSAGSLRRRNDDDILLLLLFVGRLFVGLLRRLLILFLEALVFHLEALQLLLELVVPAGRDPPRGRLHGCRLGVTVGGNEDELALVVGEVLELGRLPVVGDLRNARPDVHADLPGGHDAVAVGVGRAGFQSLEKLVRERGVAPFRFLDYGLAAPAGGEDLPAL